MAKDEAALRRRVEETTARVDELRTQFAESRDGRVGRQLLKAREKASEALAELWEACPDEEPPAQRVM